MRRLPRLRQLSCLNSNLGSGARLRHFAATILAGTQGVLVLFVVIHRPIC